MFCLGKTDGHELQFVQVGQKKTPGVSLLHQHLLKRFRTPGVSFSSFSTLSVNKNSIDLKSGHG